MRTRQEIDDVREKCLDSLEDGTQYPGLSYEEGVLDAIEWLEYNGENPVDEE